MDSESIHCQLDVVYHDISMGGMLMEYDSIVHHALSYRLSWRESSGIPSSQYISASIKTTKLTLPLPWDFKIQERLRYRWCGSPSSKVEFLPGPESRSLSDGRYSIADNDKNMLPVEMLSFEGMP